jgi:hypothetical protein
MQSKIGCQMEQVIEQAREQVNDPETGRFVAGRSANPAGRRLYKERLAAECASLVRDFAAIHNRVPYHAENISLANAARLQLRLRRPASAEDMSKMVNTVRRLLKSLGLDCGPRAASSSSKVPMPSGYEVRK